MKTYIFQSYCSLWLPLGCIDFLKNCLMGKEIILVA